MRRKEKQYQNEFINQTMQPRTSKHHILPYSRSKDDREDNTVLVNQAMHDKYHALFNNRLPVEILDFLVNYFWGGNIAYLQTYLAMKEEEYDER